MRLDVAESPWAVVVLPLLAGTGMSLQQQLMSAHNKKNNKTGKREHVPFVFQPPPQCLGLRQGSAKPSTARSLQTGGTGRL